MSDGPQPCPMGCGRTTEDPYGGPCEHCWDDVDETARAANPNIVGCLTCPKRAHKANMVNVYEGEYQCPECRWGL
jgi:hypothetical protein